MIIATESIYGHGCDLSGFIKKQSGGVVVGGVGFGQFKQAPDDDGFFLYDGIFGLRVYSVGFQGIFAGIDVVSLLPVYEGHIPVSLVESVFASVILCIDEHLFNEAHHGLLVIFNVCHIHRRPCICIEIILEFSVLQGLVLEVFHCFEDLSLGTAAAQMAQLEEIVLKFGVLVAVLYGKLMESGVEGVKCTFAHCFVNQFVHLLTLRTQGRSVFCRKRSRKEQC